MRWPVKQEEGKEGDLPQIPQLVEAELVLESDPLSFGSKALPLLFF